MTNDLTFTGEIPVTINYNGSSDDVYAPVRASSCDINIVSDQLLTDLYTARKDEVCVQIERNGEVIWEGYQTPNVYTQELSQNLDEISMTAIDPVSLMKYVKLDKILTKPNIFTYGELIGKALSYVMLDSNTLYVERNFTYDSSTTLLGMSVQVSNFWDEASEPSTLYEMIEEMLRPFCLCLCFDGKAYYIYSVNRTSETSSRTFYKYAIGTDGSLTASGYETRALSDCLWKFDNGDWTSANTNRPSLEIGSTYDKVTGVASTCKTEFNSMVFDNISYTDRDKYDIFARNVARNIVKGYVKKTTGKYTSYEIDSKDDWYYIWNGVYTDPDYGLNSTSRSDGWVNINKFYEDYSGYTGYPNESGSVVNFYGGTNNPNATSKVQSDERAVSVSKCITAYAPDNGTPPELLSRDDLYWTFDAHYDYGDQGVETDPKLDIKNSSNTKFGAAKQMQESNRIVYHQEYPNMQLIQGDEQVVDLSLNQSYSRTGINQDIDMVDSSYSINRWFWYNRIDDGQGEICYQATFSNADVYCFPDFWKSDSVKAGYPYFYRYYTGNGLCSEIWDRRRIDLYIQKSDGTVYQFNGKEWVSGSTVSASNAFYLKMLMNNKTLFNTSFKYNLIECSDGETYSLDDEEQVIYYKDSKGGVKSEDATSGTQVSFKIYKEECSEFVSSTSEGELEILLPDIDALNVSVFVNVYNSTMLGMTGTDTIIGSDIYLTYEVSGSYRYNDNGETITGTMKASDLEGGVYGSITTCKTDCRFIPYNATYVKAEHLDLDISVSVPESNLGQMFSESDIKYTLDRSSNYLETYEGPTFRVNTYHPLVKSSFSYLIADNQIAEPSSFIFEGSIEARPECYTVQAYMNWLNTIRKTYTKTLVPVSRTAKDFNTVCCFITSPETGDNNLMVVADSVDLKTNRHSITAVEDQDMQVDEVESFSIIEVPRKARNPLYNLPTSVKKL